MSKGWHEVDVRLMAHREREAMKWIADFRAAKRSRLRRFVRWARALRTAGLPGPAVRGGRWVG